MRNFKPGDPVNFLDEEGGGTVVQVTEGRVTVRDTDGFEYDYPPDRLVAINWKGEGLGDPPSGQEASGKQSTARDLAKSKGYRMTGGKVPYMEVDLHIHMLVDSERGMSNTDILGVQLAHFRRTLDLAREKRLTKVVYIHGVGKGVLREALRARLSDAKGCAFTDADFRIYGGGATEVMLRP